MRKFISGSSVESAQRICLHVVDIRNSILHCVVLDELKIH